jgi:hypothetical protein
VPSSSEVEALLKGRKVEIGDLVEESGEGVGRWWRVTDLCVTSKRAWLVDPREGYAIGWKPLAKISHATDALKGRIEVLTRHLAGAQRELRAIEKNPKTYVPPKKQKIEDR